MHEQTQQFSTPITVVRASNRRKFLVGLLGSAAILAVGSPGLWRLAQNMQVAVNTKDYPYNFGDDLVGESYSPDLNFMAMVKVHEEDNHDAQLCMWDYQQQRMTTLPTGPDGGDPVWSPDNRYLLFQTFDSANESRLDLWDMQTQQRISSYSGDSYAAFSEIHWSPDGSYIALNLDNDTPTFVIMSSVQLQPLVAFMYSSHEPLLPGPRAWPARSYVVARHGLSQVFPPAGLFPGYQVCRWCHIVPLPDQRQDMLDEERQRVMRLSPRLLSGSLRPHPREEKPWLAQCAGQW